MLLLSMLIACDDSTPATPVDTGETVAEDTGPADTDTGADALPAAWDAAPPEDLEDGAVLALTITCGLLVDISGATFIKRGDVWEVDHFDAQVLPELEACSDKSAPIYLEWDDTPSMHFLAGGFDHRMVPDTLENHWIGEVWPESEPAPECTAALGEQGVMFPVTLTVVVESLTR